MGGNRRYASYIKSKSTVTSILKLVKLYYILLRESGEAIADRAQLAFRSYETPMTEVDIKQGMIFRLRMKSRGSNFSYADALGYLIAQRTGARYLTGDDEFKSLPGVEFVK